MSASRLPHDPKWTRSNTIFSGPREVADVALIGIPAHEVSLSTTSAHQTPGAIREALARYSTYSSAHNIDLRDIGLCDLGDVDSPDHELGEKKVAFAVAEVRAAHKLLIALGGDNSITYSVAAGMWPDVS